MDGLLGNLLGAQEDPLLALLPPAQRAALQNRVRSQGMTNLGLALLQAGGPTTVPGGFGQRLGQAGMQALQANQGLMDRNLERMLAARKLQQEQLQLQRQQQLREAMAGAVTPEGVDVQALQQAAMLSDDPLASLTKAAEAVPKMRRAGMLPGAAEMDNPFELFTQSPSESVRKAAQVYSQRYAQGGIEPDAADRIVGQLTNLEERTIGRQESADARKEAQQQMLEFRSQVAEQNRQMREQGQSMQRELAQGRLDLQRQAAEDRRLARELAQAEKTESKEKRRQSSESSAMRVIGVVDDAIKLVGADTAGFGSLLAAIPETKALELEGKIKTIQANLGFDELQKMRDMSPTGGALGQVAVQELVALQSTVANLNQRMSPDALKSSLEKIKSHYNKWLSTVQQSGTQQAQRVGAQLPTIRTQSEYDKLPKGAEYIYTDGTRRRKQ